MQPSTQCFEVIATPKEGEKREFVLRRFRNHEQAAKHALSVNMALWDDVWVRKMTRAIDRAAKKSGPPRGPVAPRPWSVMWLTGGHAYVVDATGKRIAALMGMQEQREAVAGIITELTQVPSGTLGTSPRAGDETEDEQAIRQPA